MTDIRITHKRMVQRGTHHAHIQRLKGYDSSTGTEYEDTREGWVRYVRAGGYADTRDACGNVAYVKARQTPGGTWYVQTIADGVYSDNLLALPNY